MVKTLFYPHFYSNLLPSTVSDTEIYLLLVYPAPQNYFKTELQTKKSKHLFFRSFYQAGSMSSEGI
jgi:hypothetical protein